MNNLKIKFIVVAVVVTLRQLLAASAVRFWRPAKFKNLANLYFEIFQHLQNTWPFIADCTLNESCLASS